MDMNYRNKTNPYGMAVYAEKQQCWNETYTMAYVLYREAETLGHPLANQKLRIIVPLMQPEDRQNAENIYRQRAIALMRPEDIALVNQNTAGMPWSERAFREGLRYEQNKCGTPDYQRAYILYRIAETLGDYRAPQRLEEIRAIMPQQQQQKAEAEFRTLNMDEIRRKYAVPNVYKEARG